MKSGQAANSGKSNKSSKSHLKLTHLSCTNKHLTKPAPYNTPARQQNAANKFSLDKEAKKLFLIRPQVAIQQNVDLELWNKVVRKSREDSKHLKYFTKILLKRKLLEKTIFNKTMPGCIQMLLLIDKTFIVNVNNG